VKSYSKVLAAVLSPEATPEMREIVRANLAHAGMLSPDKFAPYVRDFSAPLANAMLKNQEVNALRVLGTGDESSEFRQFPDLYWPTIIELYASMTGVPKRDLVRVLAHNPAWTIPQMLELSDAGDDETKIKLMRMMRQTIAEARDTTGTRAAQAERLEMEEKYVATLVQHLDSDSQPLADAAMENLSLFYIDGRSEATVTARKELLRHGIDTDEEWKRKYRELRNIEEEQMR
jgi:hypothetical protein